MSDMEMDMEEPVPGDGTGAYKTVKLFDWVKAKLEGAEDNGRWSIYSPVISSDSYSFEQFNQMSVEQLETLGFCELEEVTKKGYVYTKEVLEEINSKEGDVVIMGKINPYHYTPTGSCGRPGFYELSVEELLEEGFITKEGGVEVFEGGTFDPKVVYASNDVKVVGPDGKKSYTIKTNLGVQTSYLGCSELH